MFHDEECDQRRHRQHERNNECTAQVSQKEIEDAHNDGSPLQQGSLHGFQRSGDQLDAIVERRDDHTIRQHPIDQRHLLFDSGHDLAAVSPAQHDGNPLKDLALSILRDASQSNRVSQTNLRHVPEIDRRPFAGGDHDTFQVRRGTRQALPIHDQLVASLLDIAAPGILVVLGHGCLDFAQGEPKTRQPVRIHEHIVLFGQTAQSIHIRKPRDCA